MSVKVFLEESEIPRQWYNLAADLPTTMQPTLGPDGKPISPDMLEDIEGRLSLLRKTGCSWWTLEVRDEAGVLQTKRIVDEYLTQSEYPAKFSSQGPLPSLTSHG